LGKFEEASWSRKQYLRVEEEVKGKKLYVFDTQSCQPADRYYQRGNFCLSPDTENRSELGHPKNPLQMHPIVGKKEKIANVY